MSAVKKQKSMFKSPSIFLENLDSTDLRKICFAFELHEKENREKSVDQLTFSNLLRQHLQKGDDFDYFELFNIIDISRIGSITWDLFASYLMLEYHEQDDLLKSAIIPQWYNPKQMPVPHKKFICQIIVTDNTPNRYYTVGKDGSFCVLDYNFHVKNSYQILTDPEEMKAKDLWVTDSCYLSNVNKVAFTTTTKEILIYEISTNKKYFTCTYKIYGMKFIPMCIIYWVEPENPTVSILAFGDTSGELHVLLFNNINNGILFENNSNSLKQSENGQKICININMTDIKNNLYSPSLYYLSHHPHSTWIRNIRYSPLLDCFITCSTTSKDALVISWLGKGRHNFRLTKFDIGSGVNSFDYHEKFNVIATGGLDNNICLWNPYVTANPVGVLTGHCHAIDIVLFVKSKNLLLTFSKDQSLRVWDVLFQICLQRFASVFSVVKSSVPVEVQMSFDEQGMVLIASINSHLKILKMKKVAKEKSLSHEKPITGLLYIEKFGQVVSVCESSTISVWSLNTGQKIRSIKNAHKDNEITAVSLDYLKTHILTAGTDGLIKVWDVNGNCYHVLVVAQNQPCEITEIVCVKNFIIAAGWSNTIVLFDANQLKWYYIYPINWKGKQTHYDTIFALTFQEPWNLLTVSYDGCIVIWNIATHYPVRKFFVTEDSKIKLPDIGYSNLISVPAQKPRKKSTARLPRSPVNPRKVSTTKDVDDTLPKKKESSVSSIGILRTRDGSIGHVADMFVTHSDGTITFWNTSLHKKIGTIIAFDTVGSLVSRVDSVDYILGVGCETGAVKLFNILNFCNDIEPNGASNGNSGAAAKYMKNVTSFINSASNIDAMRGNDVVISGCDGDARSSLVATISYHDGVISAMEFIEMFDLLFIVTSSSDCTVALFCFDQLIGVFGEPHHWNLNDFVSSRKKSLKSGENTNNVNMDTTINKVTGTCVHVKNEHVTNYHVADQIDLVRPTTGTRDKDSVLTTSRDVMDNTDLGNTYLMAHEKKYVRKRFQRKDLAAYNMTYSLLETNAMEDVTMLEKPDFINNPEKYFDNTTQHSGNELSHNLVELNTFDELSTRHDEKSIFPKYILDLESKQKTISALTGNKRFHKSVNQNRFFKGASVKSFHSKSPLK